VGETWLPPHCVLKISILIAIEVPLEVHAHPIMANPRLKAKGHRWFLTRFSIPLITINFKRNINKTGRLQMASPFVLVRTFNLMSPPDAEDRRKEEDGWQGGGSEGKDYKLTRISTMRNDRKRSKNISVCHVQCVK